MGVYLLTTTDLKNEIILELLSANKISLEETINYEKFKKLYLNYNYLSEFYFASIIGINYINYRVFKAVANNAVVLKNIDRMIDFL